MAELDAIAEPPLKRQRISDVEDHELFEWVDLQLKDLKIPEHQISATKGALQHFSKSLLVESSVEALDNALKETFPEKTLRSALVSALHGRLHLPSLPAPDVTRQDELCLWMDEALGKEPTKWGADATVKFDNNILGDAHMNKTMVVRECYVQILEQVKSWLTKQFEELDTPTGVFVITGTPGTGKSVLLGYVASLLAAHYDLVIRRNYTWWSRRAGCGQKTILHQDTEPEMLKEAKTVLLIDPVGGQTSDFVKSRQQGCSLVFISLRMTPYHSAYSQAGEHARRIFHPFWKKPELAKHWKVLFPNESEEKVKDAYDYLGGSVRWLRIFFEKIREGIGEETAARVLIRECIQGVNSFDQLEAMVSQFTPTRVVDTKESKAGYLLQIDADLSDGDKFRTPVVQFIDSETARKEVCSQLQLTTVEDQERFVRKFLDSRELGKLVGDVFQNLVLGRLAGNEGRPWKLLCTALPLEDGKKVVQHIPNQRADVQKKSASLMKIRMSTGQLYCPFSKTFPAADAFFITQNTEKTQTLWLLQLTKNLSGHPCKIGPMQETMQKHFTDLDLIEAIHWIVIVPKAIEFYKNVQKVEGAWHDGAGEVVEVKQFVSKWDTDAKS